MQNGKGDRPRPMEISRDEFDRKWEKIFRGGAGRVQAAVPEREADRRKTEVPGGNTQ